MPRQEERTTKARCRKNGKCKTAEGPKTLVGRKRALCASGWAIEVGELVEYRGKAGEVLKKQHRKRKANQRNGKRGGKSGTKAREEGAASQAGKDDGH